MAAYTEYYNTQRLHSAIYYLAPEDVLLGRTENRLRVRQEKNWTAPERIESGSGRRLLLHRLLLCWRPACVARTKIKTESSEPKGSLDFGRSGAYLAQTQKKENR